MYSKMPTKRKISIFLALDGQVYIDDIQMFCLMWVLFDQVKWKIFIFHEWLGVDGAQVQEIN